MVVVPDAIGTPHDQKSGQVAGINMVASATSSPAYWGTPGKVVLWTTYLQWLTIQVLDQFGNPLDMIYGWIDVYERPKNTTGFKKINQQLEGNGTYQDPVGVRNQNGGERNPNDLECTPKMRH